MAAPEPKGYHMEEPLPAKAKADFAHLTPDHVLDLVEAALGQRCSGLCRPLTSYINRVYELELDAGTRVVAKFYRPGRWSADALQDEQDFLAELAGEELPVIVPLPGIDGKPLQCHDGNTFAIFPKRGGRALDEPDEQQWLETGRLLGRVHVVGSRHQTRDRIVMRPDESTEEHIQYLLDKHLTRPDLHDRFEAAVDEVLDRIEPLFENVECLRIHGDLHRNNMLWRPGEPLALIDFDDMAEGPAVQDLWMLLPGRAADAGRELDLLLEGYETFRPLRRGELRLIEPLRFMRMIHYLAWCGRQQEDGGFSRLSPDWGTERFWQTEIQDIVNQGQAIRHTLHGR
jgi:Ser/Thr protein kinase RdoA (MazF antagonist)